MRGRGGRHETKGHRPGIKLWPAAETLYSLPEVPGQPGELSSVLKCKSSMNKSLIIKLRAKIQLPSLSGRL